MTWFRRNRRLGGSASSAARSRGRSRPTIEGFRREAAGGERGGGRGRARVERRSEPSVPQVGSALHSQSTSQPARTGRIPASAPLVFHLFLMEAVAHITMYSCDKLHAQTERCSRSLCFSPHNMTLRLPVRPGPDEARLRRVAWCQPATDRSHGTAARKTLTHSG